METLNNISSTVTKALWGTDETTTTTTQEPVSGKTGDVSKGQPYDAGNLGPHEQSLAQTPQPTATETEPKFDGATAATTTTTKPDLVHRGSSSSSSSSSSSESDMPAPHKTLSSSAAPGDHTKAQIDTRDPADPTADHHASAAKKDVDDSTGGLDVGDNPDKQFDGPGPRPLEVVAKEHGGDAGQNNETSSSGAPKQDTARRDSGHEEGTGEKYVKSQGLAADGGDFDAAKPGAGREADRLLDQKGVHRDPAANGGIVANKGADADSAEKLAAGSSSPKEKVSLKTKIKNKLHRSSHGDSAKAST